MAHSSESSNSNFVIAHDLRRDRERKENKCTLATCGIWKDFHLHGGKFVGTGSLVQGLFLKFEEKIHLVTSNKVISPNDYLSCYSLYFKKSKDEEKEPVELAKMVSNEVIFKSGLAIVPIDPKKLGFIRQYTSGFVNHRPFTILFKVKEDLRNDELYCHVVEESGKSMIAIRPYEVKGIADEETYVTDHSSIKIESTSFCSSHRKGLGAPIAITVKDEAVAVGAITLSNNKQLSFVLFSQIDRKRAFSDEGNGGGGEQQAPGEPAEGEEQQPPREPAGGEEQQPPGEQDGQNLNIGVGVAHMAPSDPNAYSNTEREVLCRVAQNYLVHSPPRNREERDEFEKHLEKVGTLITGVKLRSLVITVKCDSLKSLEELWKMYSCGHLGKMVQDCFVTEKILKELNLAELKLKTTMDLEEYNAYKLYFLEKDALKGASSSEFHSISSTSESPQNQEELKKWEQKTKIVETEKRKGVLPPLGSSTSDPGEELEELRMKLQIMKGASSSEFHSISSTSESPQKQEELKNRKTKIDETEKLKGCFPVLQFSTTDLEKKLDGLSMELQRLRMEGTLLPPELVTADLEEELKELLTELERQRDKGTLPPTISTIEVELDELLKKLQKRRTEGISLLIHGKELAERWRKKGMLLLPGSSTFDLEEELEELSKKLLGSLHSLPTTDLKEKLVQVFEETEMLRMKGSFSVLKLSTIDLEKKLAELSMKLQRLRMEGTLPPPELFTSDLEDELEQLEERKEGSSLSFFHTIQAASSLRQELTKVKMEALENAMYLTIRSGLAKFDVSLPEELQNYVSYLLDESAKLHLRKQVLQPPRALEELREAMNEDELKTLLTIHIREGAWQVVLLFTDELPKYKLPWDWCLIIHNEDEDEDEDENKEVSNEVIYSSTSGILKAWPTKYDPSLATLCNAITNKDWKVTRLILSMSRTPDEGLKNLSTALTQSELYSLTLHDIGLQSQGLEHLCNALTSVNCRLTNLNVRNNQLGDVGIMHLCNALANVNCRLTNLNVSLNKLGDVEITRLCKALTSVDCTLTSLNVSNSELRDVRMRYLCNALTSVNCRLTNLNVSDSKLRDLGIKHLGNALANVNCRLTNLNVSLNKLGDVGIMRLCNALTSVDCTLTSLNVSNSKFGDVGIRHLCNALANVNCRLTNLNVSSNKLGDVGIMHLCDALTSVDCTLPSLNVSFNQLGDNGLKHLCDALTSRNCALTKLKVRFNSLGDRGIKELSEVLTSGFCALTSLDVSGNEFGDVGIKHLCRALTDTKCKLQSLNLCSNRYVTEDGKKYLSQMLTGTDWEDKGALRLSRSTTK